MPIKIVAKTKMTGNHLQERSSSVKTTRMIRDSLPERRDANVLTMTDALMDDKNNRDKNRSHRVAEDKTSSRTLKAKKVLEVFLRVPVRSLLLIMM